jgi:LPS-assembly protein
MQGGGAGVTLVSRSCSKHSLRQALLVGVLAVAFAPLLAHASPRELPLPPLPPMHAVIPAPAAPAPDDGLQGGGFYLEADQVIDDDTNHIVSAHGQVEARYNGRVLRADDVVYNQSTGIATATGHVTIVNPDGSAENSQSAVLDREMSEGVAIAFSTRMTENVPAKGASAGGPVTVTIAAASAVHSSPTITEMNQAVFTACPVCAKKPVPTWSIRAKKIIEDKKRQIIIFRDAVIEIKGMPVMYAPALVTADPATPRKSGFLIPEISISSLRGFSYEQPYLQVISPSEDLVVSPQINSKVNPFLNVDWRKEFYSGAIDVRAGYTYEQDFNSEGDRLGNLTSRSYILAKGLFAITDNWDWGFTAERASDPLIFDRYSVVDPFIDRGLYSADDRRLISQLFTTYNTQETYISVSAADVQGLRSNDFNNTFPAVAPLVEAHYEPDASILGGRLQIDGSGVMLFRDSAPLNTSTLAAYSQAATSPTPLPPPPFTQGIDSQRGTIEANWQTTYILGDGIRIDPFLDFRSDVYGLQKLPSPYAPDATIFRDLPTAGLTVSWPFFKRYGDYTYILEPIAQIAIAPFLRQDPRIPIEDSVDFQFDETNLFQANKSPGFDLLDSGQRLNVGGRATMQGDDGFFASALIGRSFRAEPDPDLPANSGLQGTESDWILAADASPFKGVNFFTRWRLDSKTFGINYMETGVDVTTSRFDGQIRYIQEAEDADGNRVQDLDFHGEVFITKNWGLSAYGAREFTSGVWRQADFGIVYRDECIRVEILYNHNDTNNGVLGPSQGVGIRLSLATFGNSDYPNPDTTAATPR